MATLRPFTPDDILHIETVGDPQIAPDGSRVVYTVTTLDAETDTTSSTLWLAETSGGVPRQLTHGRVRDSSPRWSQDGATIAFLGSRDGGPPQVRLLPLAGGEPHALTHLHHGAGTPVWSPDGTQIAFAARVTPEGADANAPRATRRLRTFLNGSVYIGDGSWHLFVADVAGGETRQITAGDWHHFSPTWSPDGARLACISTRREDWDIEWVWDVFMCHADGGNFTQITRSAGVCQGPAWSPDGATIAYYDNGNPGTGSTEDYHLHLVPAAGGEATSLSGHLDRGVNVGEPPAPANPPLWSPDGQSLLAVLSFAGNAQCYRITTDGEAMRVIGGMGDAHGPSGAGSTGWPSMSADGARLAFAWTGPESPAAIWAYDPIGSARHPPTQANYRCLTLANRGFDNEITFSNPERFAIMADDGKRVESLLWLPPGQKATDGPFPTLLHLHGGPHGATGEQWSNAFQMLAGHGFAVVSVNFRGSAGYGKSFADTILADWGAKEHADAMAAIDDLIARGIADPDRLGVYGGSYGGYMTNYVITHTDRFRAAVTMATISDLATLSGTTDQWESVDFDSGGPPWEREAYYRAHSAMPLVARITTPLLILHGEEDHTCRVTEAEQLFAALRKLRREVEFVRYPGEAHGFMRGRPRTQRDAHARLLAWFVEHLGDEKAETRRQKAEGSVQQPAG